jgi:hypothetical protein
MIYLVHEETIVTSPRFGSRAAVRPCPASPGSRGWYEDRGSVAGTGGPAFGMDNPSTGSNPHELESMGRWGEPRRYRVSSTKASAWPSWTTDRGACPTAAGSSSDESSGVWVVSGGMGWPNAGCPFEEILWDKSEGSTSPEVDASVRLSDEACRLCLPSGPFGRCQAVSSVVKKNSEALSPKRPLSFKTRQVLACIPAWAEDGQNGESLLRFQQQASIESV